MFKCFANIVNKRFKCLANLLNKLFTCIVNLLKNNFLFVANLSKTLKSSQMLQTNFEMYSNVLRNFKMFQIF